MHTLVMVMVAWRPAVCKQRQTDTETRSVGRDEIISPQPLHLLFMTIMTMLAVNTHNHTQP